MRAGAVEGKFADGFQVFLLHHPHPIPVADVIALAFTVLLQRVHLADVLRRAQLVLQEIGLQALLEGIDVLNSGIRLRVGRQGFGAGNTGRRAACRDSRIRL